MNANKTFVILIKAGENSNGNLHLHTVKDTLSYDRIKALLGEDICIDIIERKIGGNYYDIIIDDEGKLKENCLISGACSEPAEVLTGDIIICKHDAAGNTVGLTATEVEDIRRYIKRATADADINNPFGGGRMTIKANGNVLLYEC